MKYAFIIFISSFLFGCASHIPINAPETVEERKAFATLELCLFTSAEKFSKSGEQIQDVIDASINKCSPPLQNYREVASKQFEFHKKNSEYVDARLKMRTAQLKEKLKQHIIEVRSR